MVSCDANPQPIVVATTFLDQVSVGVIEEEHAVELLARRARVIAAVRSRLRIGQELDRRRLHNRRPILAVRFDERREPSDRRTQGDRMRQPVR